MAVHKIEHSGQTFECLWHAIDGRCVWPIEEFIVRTELSEDEEKMLRRIYQNGIPEGSYVSGLNRIFERKSSDVP